VFIESDGADCALFVAAMMFGSVRILAAAEPGFAFGGRDEVRRIAKGDAVLRGETLGAFGDEHHVRAFFEDRAGGANGILDAMQAGDGAGAQRGGVHDDGIAFDVPVEVEMRAVTGVEDGIIFESDDGGFNGVERVAPPGKDRPAGLERAAAAGLAGVGGVIGNVPRTAVNDERRAHGGKG